MSHKTKKGFIKNAALFYRVAIRQGKCVGWSTRVKAVNDVKMWFEEFLDARPKQNKIFESKKWDFEKVAFAIKKEALYYL